METFSGEMGRVRGRRAEMSRTPAAGPGGTLARLLQDEVREGREASEAGAVVICGYSKLQWFIPFAVGG